VLKGLNHKNCTVNRLNKGEFFGEIGLITKLNRTATITSMDYCTFAMMKKSCIKKAKKAFPSIYLSIRAHISSYQDFDFRFKRNMV
jgi:CRP-like cAMP-binding protein